MIPFHGKCFLSKGTLVSVAQLGYDARGNGDRGAVLVLEVLPEQSLSMETCSEEGTCHTAIKMSKGKQLQSGEKSSLIC